MSAFTHTPEALESAEAFDGFTGWNLDRHASKYEWAGVGLVSVTQHRDSDAVERSNFDSAKSELSEKFGKDSVAVVSFGHWAVGWVEILTFDTGVEGLAEAVAGIKARLEKYALLDESLWSEYEWSENHPEGENTCYADKREQCSCELPNIDD
jgi:hypothetical protein